MNCVNKKSKEFKKLVADYNVSENTMELLIHKYWREKRSEEDFPTRAYLNAHLGLIPYEETVDNVIKVWDKMYAHPITFKKRNDAYKAKKNALRLFPPQAVLLRLNDKGEYILTIRKPVKNLKAELDKIVGNGSFSTMSLNLHIDNSKKYPVNKVESLFNKFNSDRTSKALADKVFSLANSLDISVYFTDMKDENLGKYVPGKGIYLNKDFFSSLDNNERKANVILHETIHAICNYALSDVIKDENKSQTVLDFKNDITQIYDTVKFNKTLEGELGITNVKEFVAELSNPLFREKLQKIEDNNKTSLWQRIIDALKKLLNLHSSSDYYTRAMNTLNNALDAFDKNTYMEYNGILNELRESQNKNYQLSDKAKAFVDSLSEGELNDITGIINREISDFNLVAKDNQSKKNNQSSDNGKIYFTFNDGTQVEAPFVLNEQQANALNEMNRFIHSNETSMTLSGYAGTGKTSIMEMLRNRAWKANKDVIFTASTNKAAAVLKSKVGNAMTLNKAFGISVEVNSKKKYNAKDLVTKIKDDNKIRPGSIVVIDEASMINEENYNTLNQIAQFMGAKIIYVGDSAQLAPVKETKVSKVFRDENGKTVTLTQVERTGDNAILREATDVRNGQGLSGISSFNSEGKGVAYVRPQQKKEIGDIVKHFLPQIKENPDNFKIIAFTNNKVALYNEAVRKNMGYNDNTPRVGESIMGYLNYGYRRGGSYDFINSQNYKVVHVSPTHENIIIVNGNTYKTLVNDVTLEGSDGEINTFTFTDVKQNQHNRQVAYILGKEVVRLWEDYRWRGVKDNLDKINAINSALFINDDIKEGERVIAPKVYDFGYAITAHKSQGSTFKNVLIDDVDIQTAKQSDVDLGVPSDNYDIVDPSSMMPAGKVAINDVHDMNGATELNSTPFSLGEETSSEAKPVTKNIPDTISLVQQLEYVAISRATDTATIISNNVKKEGSPLHPEQSVKEDMVKFENQPTIPEQLISHLKSQGINVKDRAAMAEFLKTHKLEHLQQAIAEQKEMDTIKQKAIADGTFMKAPNGKPTNLNERQWLQVRTTNFKKWFGDWENNPSEASKIVDENGEPLVVYHGGENNISSFITYHQDSEVGDMYGAYFTKDKKYAKTYNKGTLYEVFLNIRNPLATEGNWTGIINKKLKETVTSKHDGIINDKFDNGILQKLHLAKTRTEVIVFNPNQVKSATNNNGNFSLTDDDIQAFVDKYDLPKGELPSLASTLMTKYGNKTAYGDVVYTANYEYTVNYKGAGEFDIIECHKIDNNLKEKINDEERRRVSGTLDRLSTRDEIAKSQYSSDSYHVENRETNGNNVGLDKQTSQGKSNQTSSDVGSSQNKGWSTIKRDSATGRITFVEGDGKTISTVEDWKGMETFTTPQGEVYGFVDKEGNIYLDETKISPEHPIHEYTHLWDRTVQKKNPKLWQRGVELMKQTSLWNEILNDENYGKLWQAQNFTQEKLDNLIASEVHARFTGEGGAQLLEKLAKEKGQSNIIEKLKQWILDVWKDLKATFGNWSQEDIDKLTLKDFNHMTVRDFADGINLKDANNATYTPQQHNEPNKPIMSTLPEGPIKPSESQKVFLPGYEHFDREVKNGEQKGIEVDAEWKIPLLKELDSKIYNPSEEYEALGLKYDKDKQHERLNNEFCINQINVLLRRIHSKDDWNNLELRNKLIKEEYEQNQYDKLARQIDNLNNPMDKDGSKYFDTPLTSSEVKHAVEMAMDYASDIITKLQAEGEEYAKEINFDFQPKKGFDFKTASRQEVIEAVGLSNIFNAVHEWFNYTNDWCDTDEALDEAGNKMSFLHENWDAVMWMGAPFFNFNEGFGFKEQIGGTVERTQEDNQLPHDETYNKEDEEDVLVELFGEGREHYLVDSRTIDVLGSMSTTVKRAIHECYKLDEEGNPIVNRTWGLKERVSVKDATINILSWTQGAVTYEDMLAKISQKAKLKKNNWVNQLLIKLNDNSGQYTDFQSQFFSVFCKHRTTYTVAVDQDGKISSIPANKNPVLKQVIDAAKAKFNADETPLFNARKVNTSLLGNEETISDRYVFNLHKAYNELKTLDDSLNIRVNYQRQRRALTEEQLEEASETLAKVMQAVGFSFVKEEIEDILDESSLHQMTDALRIIIKEMSRANSYKTKNPDSNYEIAPFSYTSDNGVIGALRNLVRPITDVLEESNQNTVYDDGKLYQEFTIPSFLSKLFQKFNIKDENKFHEFIAEEYGKSEFFSLGHSFDTHYLREKYEWRLPWLNLMSNGNKHREHFDHRVNLSYKGKGYMKKMSDLDYAMSVLSQYWSMSSNMRDYTPSYFRMPMQSNKPTEDYIGFVAYRDKESYKKSIVEGRSSELGLYHMFLTELSRIQTVRMRNKDAKEDPSAIKNFDTNGRNFCFFKFLNPYLNGITHKGDSMNLLAPKRVFDDNGNTIENYDDAKFAKLLQKKVKGEETLTSDEELELGKLAKSAIYNYLQDRFDGILDSWQVNGLVKAARNITNIAEHPSYIENTFDKNSQKAEYDEREKKIDSYIRSQLENFLWNDYFATKNILMLTVGDTAFYKDEEDLQKRLAQLHAPGVRGRVSAVDYKGNLVSDGKYRTVVLKDFDKVKSNIIANISEVFDRKIAAAPDNMKAQWKALKENVLRAYSEINVADAEGYTCPTAYRKKAIMFGKWSKEAEAIYQKITKGENVDFTEIKQAFQPLKPFVYSHLQKPMGIDNAPITNMYCPFQAKNSEYLLVMADVLLRNENTSRPNLLKVIFDIMEDSAFDGRQRNEKGKITTQGTYNGKGIDTIQFESAIKSSLQGAVDIAQFADDLIEGEKKAKDELYKSIYKTDTESYNSSAYNTDVFVHELPFEDYCLQQEVPDHFKDHEQAHGSQTRMIIPSDLEEYYDENVSKDNPDNIVKYEYDEWQEITKGKWEKVHVSKTAKEVKEDYENTIYENIVTSLDSLVQELHLNASSKVEQNLALSKILQRELHSSSRYGIDLIQACTIDKVTGEFRIPKGDPIQCKRIEQLINSIIKNRVNKQLIPGGPIVQVSNFGVSRQLQIRFNDKKGNLLPTKEEYDSSKHEDQSYEDYCKKNQGGIAYFEVFAPAWSEELYRNFADEDGTIDVEALNDIDPDLLKLITYRIPTEDKCSIAPCKIVGFLPKEAGSTIMLPYELTSQDGSDFDIDKRYVMRKALDIVLDYKKIADKLYKKVSEKKNYNEETSNKIKDDIDTFLKVINSDHAYTAKYLDGGKVLTKMYNELKENRKTWRTMYKTARPKDRNMRNNKIIDISWAVLTNPTSADKVLKPEGFDEQKKVGYMIAAYRNNPDISWEELEQIANSKDDIKNLKKLSYTEKDLAFFDTQLQFYKQNAAAASLIGVFAVNKIAHSILEGDGIYLTALGSSPFTIGHMQFKEKMELDPRFDTEGNNIGNVLGSLVGASADAVKDPILNLMNINMNTANILNALLRLGMSFKEAAMFLSQSIITKALAEFDKQNLDGYASIRNIVSNKVKEMNQKNHYTSDSNIVTEEISPEELVEGLLEGDHEALDYKVLIAFNKILDIADKLRNPTLVTRFNSIAGAVGPLTIDNLMTEYKLKNFTTLNKESTGFECQDKDGEWLSATFSTILEKHPILAGFYSTYGLANRMFSDTPAGSNGFNKVINSLGVLGGKIMGNRQLLNSLVNFYSTFLLVDSGLVDSSKLEYYIKNFPKEFSRIKDSGKYKNNKLVESIFLKEYSKSSTPALQVNLTGLDTLTKEELSSAWIDLYHDNKNLALKLFAYNVFKGGLEFSPKTFISLLPNYIKERIVKQLPDGKKLSYLDVFRKLDFSNVDPALVVDQFVRNNWDNNSLVPYVKITKDMLFQNNVVTIATDEDKAKVTDCPYIKMKIGDKLTLLKYDDKSPDKKVMHYKVIAPLGNNKEYLEMSVHDIIQPMSVVNQGNEELETSHISSDNLVADGTTTLIETFTQETSTQNESKKALDLAEMFMAYNSKYDRRKANEIIGNYKRNLKEFGKLFGPQINLLKEVFEKQGLQLNDKQVIEKFNELC